jgi:UDP-N-acetylmuramate: L-alanyl-gamma-D-glutamyl-meso-diaminopimelate ligase
MSNLLGAMKICAEIGISQTCFMKAMGSFKGAARRLEMVNKNDVTSIFKDFAHAPSKLKATTKAVKEQFPGRELVACMELHTFSSLNKKFLPHYRGCMEAADIPLVYFNPHAIKLKRLPGITSEDVKAAFDHPGLEVFNDSSELRSRLMNIDWQNKNLLMMSSGDFDGIDINILAGKILRLKI